MGTGWGAYSLYPGAVKPLAFHVERESAEVVWDLIIILISLIYTYLSCLAPSGVILKLSNWEKPLVNGLHILLNLRKLHDSS